MLFIVVIRYHDSPNPGLVVVPAESSEDAINKVRIRRADYQTSDANYNCWGVVGNVPVLTEPHVVPMISLSEFIMGKLSNV